MINGGKMTRDIKREVKTLIQCFILQGRGEELKRKKVSGLQELKFESI